MEKVYIIISLCYIKYIVWEKIKQKRIICTNNFVSFYPLFLLVIGKYYENPLRTFVFSY